MQNIEISIIKRKIERLLLNVANESDLYQQLCETLTQLTFITVAWVGAIQKDSFEIKLIAHAGLDKKTFSNLEFTWDGSPYSPETTVTAVKAGQMMIINDIKNNHQYNGWRDGIQEMKSGSFVSIPLFYATKVIGILNLYAEEEYAFVNKRVAFLKEIEAILALWIKSIMAEQAVLEAQHAAAVADSIKNQFVNNLSHEIRTPMNSIVGLTDLTLMTDLTDEQRENLELVKISASSLFKIITEVLDYSKLENDEMVQTIFNLKDKVNDVIMMFASAAREKGIELCLVYDENLSEAVIGDAAKIIKVLCNLLGNALKFTNQGKIAVEVLVEEQKDEYAMIRLGISDTGIGIAQDKREFLFESFSQLDNTYTKTYGGIGLGLASSKKIVELLGGQIWVESQEGLGSKFYFTTRVKMIS